MKKFQGKLLLVLFVLFACLGVSLFHENKASALSSIFPDRDEVFVDPNTLVPAGDGDNAYIEVARVGGGNSLDAPYTAVDVYFEDFGTKPNHKTITIKSARSCGGPDWQDVAADGSKTTTFTVVARNTGNNVYTFSNAGNCASGSDITFDVQASAAGTSVKIGATTFYSYRIIARAEIATGFVNAFQVSAVSNNGGKAFVTTPEEVPGAVGADAFFALQRRPGAGSGLRTFSLPFAPACETNGSQRFEWFDDDWNTIEGGKSDYQMKLQSRKRLSTNNWNDARIDDFGSPPGTSPGLVSAGGGWFMIRTTNGGSGSTGYFDFTSNDQLEYRILWRNVSGENGIRYKLPFSEINRRVDCQTTSGATCSFVNPANATVGINSPQSVTVSVANSGTTKWDSSYSLRQTYVSTINTVPQTLTRDLNGGSVGGVPYTGPGYLDGNTSGVFKFSVSRGYAGTYTFDFQMQRNGALVGAATNCRMVITVTNQPPTRPDCNMRIVVNGTEQGVNQSVTLAYGNYDIRVRGQQANNTTVDWGVPTNLDTDSYPTKYSRYYMVETYNGSAQSNLGYIRYVKADDGGAFNYTRDFESPHGVLSSGDYSFVFRVYVAPPPPDNATFNAWRTANPPPAIPPFAGTGAATTYDCPVNLHIAQREATGSLNGVINPCDPLTGTLTWSDGGAGAPNGYVYFDGNSALRINVTGPFFSVDPYTVPGVTPFGTHTAQLIGINGDGSLNQLGTPVKFGPCVSATCSYSNLPDLEPGEQASGVKFYATFKNSTSQTLSVSVRFSWPAALYIAGRSSPTVINGSVGPYSQKDVGMLNETVALSGKASIIIQPSINGAAESCGSGSLPGCDTPAGCYIDTPQTQPFIKAYGADVRTGGWFNDGSTECSRLDTNYQAPKGNNYFSGGVRTFGRIENLGTSNNEYGSVSKYGILSLGLVEGNVTKPLEGHGAFSSLLHRDTPNYDYKYLTMANDLPSPEPYSTDRTNYLGGIYGGAGGGSSQCITDYFNVTRNLATATASTGGPSVSSYNNAQYYFNPGGQPFVLEGGIINKSMRVSIYIDGDVYIKGDIKYVDAAVNNVKIDEVPYFALIVRGNIYVSKSVDMIEGLYVAQPNLADTDVNSKGTFVSCSEIDGSGLAVPIASVRIGNECNRRLLINGAVIARKGMWLRSNGSLVTARKNESVGFGAYDNGPTTDSITMPCNGVVRTLSVSRTNTVNGGCIVPGYASGEVINYIPELMLGRPSFKSPQDSVLLPGVVDTLYQLPPIF